MKKIYIVILLLPFTIAACDQTEKWINSYNDKNGRMTIKINTNLKEEYLNANAENYLPIIDSGKVSKIVNDTILTDNRYILQIEAIEKVNNFHSIKVQNINGEGIFYVDLKKINENEKIVLTDKKTLLHYISLNPTLNVFKIEISDTFGKVYTIIDSVYMIANKPPRVSFTISNNKDKDKNEQKYFIITNDIVDTDAHIGGYIHSLLYEIKVYNDNEDLLYEKNITSTPTETLEFFIPQKYTGKTLRIKVIATDNDFDTAHDTKNIIIG